MRTALDCKNVKGVRVWVLLRGNEICGRMVASFSDNPRGSVCTATISAWAGPLAGNEKLTGRAGGGGYDKLSSAISSALNSGGFQNIFAGVGTPATIRWFKSQGYDVHDIL